MSSTRRTLIIGGASAAGLGGFPAIVRAQQKFEVKVANFVGPQHFQSQWLVKWGEELEKQCSSSPRPNQRDWRSYSAQLTGCQTP